MHKTSHTLDYELQQHHVTTQSKRYKHAYGPKLSAHELKHDHVDPHMILKQ